MTKGRIVWLAVAGVFAIAVAMTNQATHSVTESVRDSVVASAMLKIRCGSLAKDIFPTSDVKRPTSYCVQRMKADVLPRNFSTDDLNKAFEEMNFADAVLVMQPVSGRE
jgi:hypothetical protein